MKTNINAHEDSAPIKKFDGVTRLLHWVSALIILWTTAAGLFIAFFDAGEIIEHAIADFNVSLTFVFIPIFIWRITHRIRKYIESCDDWIADLEKKIAKVMHVTLYILIAIVLITGVLMMNRDYYVFNLFFVPQFIHDEDALQFFFSIHVYATRTLGACVLIHILALIKHEMSGDKVLERML
jgi:cytochrome b561